MSTKNDHKIFYQRCELGWAHEKRNLARRTVNFTPVIEHNIQNQDLHHKCLALHDFEPTSTKTLSIGVLEKL